MSARVSRPNWQRLSWCGVALFGAALWWSGESHAASPKCPALLDHRFTTLQGEKINLCQYADRPILVVNTASKCGYTPQFEKLEQLYRQHQGRLLVVGFPSNDFLQELTSNKEIADFCKLTYFVQFPMIEKSVVRGPHAMPFYQQLRTATGESPRWNFHKYVILPQASKVLSFGSSVEPDSAAIQNVLRPYLAAS
ncbi:glutathione peroxidase [Aquaspirillum soli]